MLSVDALATPSRARLLAHLTLISWLSLAATGTWLMFFYRPTAPAAYADMETLRSGITFDLWIRRIHRWLVVPAALLPLAATFIHFRHATHRSAWIALGAFGAVAAAWFTGLLLPWDQLALWSVTVGTNMAGFEPVFGDDVRFVLLGGTEVTPERIIFWLQMHTLAIPAVLAIIALIYWRAARSSASSEAQGAVGH